MFVPRSLQSKQVST